MPGPNSSSGRPVTQSSGRPVVRSSGRPDTQEPITLAQFLKVVQVAPTGGHAKNLVREGRATVNGQPEDRPGRKLAEGDVVAIDGKTFTVDR